MTSGGINAAAVVPVSAEMEAFLDCAVPEKFSSSSNNHEDSASSYADDFTEEDSSEATSATTISNVSSNDHGDTSTTTTTQEEQDKSWLSSLWDLMVSLYVPFLIQLIFGASFYIVRTLLLGYVLQYTVQFFVVAEHWTVQWLGGASGTNSVAGGAGAASGKHHNSTTPLPVLIGLAVLTMVALIVHPDGYTWIILRKIRCVAFAGRRFLA